MRHRRGLISALVAIEREASRAKARAARETVRVERRRERDRIATEKELERLSYLSEKERIRLAHERMEQEAEAQTRELIETVEELTSLLRRALGNHHGLDFEALKPRLRLPEFSSSPLGAVGGSSPRRRLSAEAPGSIRETYGWKISLSARFT
jgi:hypothetical protein